MAEKYVPHDPEQVFFNEKDEETASLVDTEFFLQNHQPKKQVGVSPESTHLKDFLKAHHKKKEQPQLSSSISSSSSSSLASPSKVPQKGISLYEKEKGAAMDSLVTQSLMLFLTYGLATYGLYQLGVNFSEVFLAHFSKLPK